MTVKLLNSARERELFRYYQPAENDSPVENERKFSKDPCLAAFAQLGALRMNTKRSYITLTTGDPNSSDYILAEAGPDFSLQYGSRAEDELWHGAGLVAKSTGMSSAIIAEFNQPQDPQKYVFIADLLEDAKYKIYHAKSPRLRSLVAVPLKSVMHGFIIGTYCVIDDRPRESVSEFEIQFMREIATIVGEHLEAERMKRVQHRAERMIKALGLFIEGKSTLRDWWLEEGHRSQRYNLRKRVANERPLELLADLEFGIQERVDYYSKHGLHELQCGNRRNSFLNETSSSSTLSQHEKSKPETEFYQEGRKSSIKMPENHYNAPSESITPAADSFMDRNFSFKTSDTALTEHTPEVEKNPLISFDVTSESTQKESSPSLRNSMLRSNIKKVFARASNLIRESISVEGVVYFDTVVDSSDTSSNRHSHNHMNDDVLPGTDSASPRGQYTNSTPLDTNTEQTCKVLGYSTKTRSSFYGHHVLDRLNRFSVSIFSKMLRDYPRGSIFYFAEDGSLHTESDDSLSDPQREQERKAQGDAIISILPGARSVFWFPLWDLSRDRWYSGSLVWSNCPTRVLCPVEDLNYLAAFGNSIMAEVSRLSTQVLSKMKTDFISSISHELRSPLHGVLASVEFLRETKMNELQIDMTNNIYASGKILLDTINHVLDFSKVNLRARNGKRVQRFLKNKAQSRLELHDETEKADMCIVSEEVVDTIFNGYIVSKKAFAPVEKEARHTLNREICPVSIILDIPFRQNWTFNVDKGAWRRILMNLFSNSMKYTSTGFVKLSLSIEESPNSTSDKKSSRSMLVLKIKDSGRGISEEFLKHQLYKPFSQEDSLSIGAGLGLSIVKAIVQDLNGKITFVSELGAGTEVAVWIPLKQSSIPKKVEERKFVMDVRKKCFGLTVQMLGFDRCPDLNEEPTGILTVESETAIKLCDAMKSCLGDWFGIHAVSPAQKERFPDLVVTMEAELSKKSIEEALNSLISREAKNKTVVIVLSNRYQASTKTSKTENFEFFYLHQPFGPHKIAKILNQAFCHPNEINTGGDAIISHDGFDTHTSSPKSLNSQSPTNVSSKIVSNFTSLNTTRISPLPPPKPPTLASHPIKSVIKSEKKLPSPSTAPPPADKIQSFSIQKDLHVLLVEDNEINLRLLIATMHKLKLRHVTAMNGLEALNAYKKYSGQFDVIFMDISMPVMSGIESSKHIRCFERENNIEPVALIALTGAANEQARQEAFNSGIDLFLTKPVPMKVLRGMLDDLRCNGRAIFAG